MKHLKKINLLVLLVASFLIASVQQSKAQLGQGNYLVGGDLGNFNLGINKGAPFIMRIDPKLATFVTDNLALGGYLDLNLQSQTGNNYFTYGIGPLARYYSNASKLAVIKHSKVFFEANFGFQGTHSSIKNAPSYNTNGLGFGFGPGFSYFITQNVAVETLLKYRGNVGFGNNPYAQNLELGVGFQIFLPSSRAKRVLKDVSGAK